MAYDTALAKQCMEWIQEVTKETNFDTSGDINNVQSVLKDGVVLCKLINALNPGSVREKAYAKAPKMPFQQMELIAEFLKGVSAYGIPDREKFQTVDLFEKQNMRAVLICFQSLARKAKSEGKPGFL